MDLPRRFAYNPQWRIILFGFAFGGAFLFLGKIHWMFFVFGIPITVFASMLTLRRLVFKKFLELERDALSIPRGFLRTQLIKIPYANIENGWERTSSSTETLTLQIKGHTFEIHSMMLPDAASYIVVRDFIKSHFIQKEKPVQPIEGGKYCFKCSYEGNGEIYNSNGEIVWRVKTLYSSLHYPYGFFRLADFVVYDKSDRELFRIKLGRKWALAQFVMIENGLPICTVKLRSILRNKYSLNFANGQKWIFRMPLFTVNFGGLSEMGEKIRVRLWSHNVWYVLIDANVDSPQLVAALAFIHRERRRFG